LECQISSLRECLVINTIFSSFIFTFPKNNQLQNILTFFTFYITLIIFYYYLNKIKIHHNTKLFHLFINFFFTFYHINHFLQLLKKKKKGSTQQSLPNTTLNQLFKKHGIYHTHQNSGRKHRHIVETELFLLAHASIPHPVT
jgi:hypothetical protein